GAVTKDLLGVVHARIVADVLFRSGRKIHVVEAISVERTLSDRVVVHFKRNSVQPSRLVRVGLMGGFHPQNYRSDSGSLIVPPMSRGTGYRKHAGEINENRQRSCGTPGRLPRYAAKAVCRYHRQAYCRYREVVNGVVVGER